MRTFAKTVMPRLMLAGLILGMLVIGGSGNLRRDARIGEASPASEAEVFPEAPLAEARPVELTLRERAALLCQTAGALVEPQSRAIAQSAARHNRLQNLSNKEFADMLTAVLVTENSGGTLWRVPGMLDTIYPFWDGLQVASNSIGLDYSVGIGRIRPHTAQELRQGWIEHQGRIIYHNVRVSSSVDGRGSQGVSSARLADDEVSIEYLAANFEMGTAVAHAFAAEPTLLDLARWHNSGIGPWGWTRVSRNQELWEKGSRYLLRVEDAAKTLASINGLAGCAALGPSAPADGEEVN